MTMQARERIEERLDAIEREIEEEKNEVRKVLLRREHRILSGWDHVEQQCKRDGIVEVW